ncbi:MAG: hypothetical protein COW42_00625 [Deltaproteobacteria bacterium CG17_big_fil_post_rev_8_21_14_2_50_63_7]|nr:MAG: hypothetical protein COW42_00625 [Deltaproteobacteria bacterium CG17_big_fil_post_rev_8_21_14_2_50_63_7]
MVPIRRGALRMCNTAIPSSSCQSQKLTQLDRSRNKPLTLEFERVRGHEAFPGECETETGISHNFCSSATDESLRLPCVPRRTTNSLTQASRSKQGGTLPSA